MTLQLEDSKKLRGRNPIGEKPMHFTMEPEDIRR